VTDLIAAPYCLPSPDLIELEQEAAEIASQARSANTMRAYQSDWSHFTSWCRAKGLQTLPATPRTVALYMTAHKDRYSMATLNRRLSAIAAAHRMADHVCFRGRAKESHPEWTVAWYASAQGSTVLEHYPTCDLGIQG
jgi:hypothetical protein